MMEIIEIKQAIESIVMVADGPVEPSLLAQLLEVPRAEIERAASELADAYAVAGHGFVLAKVAGGYRFQSHPDQSHYVERFVLEGQSARLSNAALETLAIVAYKQPISRMQIAAIRGVNVDGVLRTLVQRGYVDEVGRDPGPGNASLFGTTTTFLERLGLDTLDDLPSLVDFVPGADVVEALEQGLRPEPLPDAVDPAEGASATPEAEAAPTMSTEAGATGSMRPMATPFPPGVEPSAAEPSSDGSPFGGASDQQAGSGDDDPRFDDAARLDEHTDERAHRSGASGHGAGPTGGVDDGADHGDDGDVADHGDDGEVIDLRDGVLGRVQPRAVDVTEVIVRHDPPPSVPFRSTPGAGTGGDDPSDHDADHDVCPVEHDTRAGAAAREPERTGFDPGNVAGAGAPAGPASARRRAREVGAETLSRPSQPDRG